MHETVPGLRHLVQSRVKTDPLGTILAWPLTS